MLRFGLGPCRRCKDLRAGFANWIWGRVAACFVLNVMSRRCAGSLRVTVSSPWAKPGTHAPREHPRGRSMDFLV